MEEDQTLAVLNQQRLKECFKVLNKSSQQYTDESNQRIKNCFARYIQTFSIVSEASNGGLGEDHQSRNVYSN